MKQNRNQYRTSGADRDPSLRSFASQTSRKVVRLDTRIPVDHPLRAIRALVDETLTGLSRDFNKSFTR